MGIHAILLARPGLQHPQPGVHVSMYGKLYVHTFFLPNHQYRTYIALSYNQLPSPSSPVPRYFYICVCQSGESQDVTNFLVEKKNTRRKMIQTCSHYSQGNWPNYLNARTWIYRVGRHGKEMGRVLCGQQHISAFIHQDSRYEESSSAQSQHIFSHRLLQACGCCGWGQGMLVLDVLGSLPSAPLVPLTCFRRLFLALRCHISADLSLAVAPALCFCLALLLLKVKPTMW